MLAGPCRIPSSCAHRVPPPHWPSTPAPTARAEGVGQSGSILLLTSRRAIHTNSPLAPTPPIPPPEHRALTKSCGRMACACVGAVCVLALHPGGRWVRGRGERENTNTPKCTQSRPSLSHPQYHPQTSAHLVSRVSIWSVHVCVCCVPS